jgi:hypothetical protein
MADDIILPKLIVEAQSPPAVVKPAEPVVERAPRPENPEVQGAELWLRRWKLTVGTAVGDKAIDLSELAFEFSVEQATFLLPYVSQITVYNIPHEILGRMQKELTHVALEAGYRSAQYGKIFAGPIVYYKHGRQNATDTFVEIHALQNDQALSGSIINTLLLEGSTQEDVIKAATEAMKGDVKPGQIMDLGKEKSPRARVLHGNPADILRDVAAHKDARIWIDTNGKLHVIGKDEALAMQTMTVPILTPKTGLIDVPSATLGGGVEARCLLNPNLLPGGIVKIDTKQIQQIQEVNKGALGVTPQQIQQLDMTKGSMRSDGYYSIVSVKHWGQNRGNPWYSDMKTFALDPTKQAPGFRPV